MSVVLMYGFCFRVIRKCLFCKMIRCTDRFHWLNALKFLCRGGQPRPPAITTCLSGYKFARLVGALRSCRSRRCTLAPFLSIATLSAPGPRAKHPTSHRVGGLVVGFDFGGDDEFRVGADRRVRPHGNARLLWMTDAEQMSKSLCRGGLPRPPAITNCLSGFQFAREVGASRSCRSRRYRLSSLLSVATLSSPGPHAQHPTSHRVGVLVGCLEFGYVDNFCVGADRRVRPHR